MFCSKLGSMLPPPEPRDGASEEDVLKEQLKKGLDCTDAQVKELVTTARHSHSQQLYFLTARFFNG